MLVKGSQDQRMVMRYIEFHIPHPTDQTHNFLQTIFGFQTFWDLE